MDASMPHERRRPRVRSLGIDLAAQPAGTAACVLAWEEGERRVESIELGVDDDRIATLHRDVDVTAIDAPFGWPVAFARRVGAYAAGAPWPDEPPGPDLWLRHTDLVATGVAKGPPPLSVSSDRIARPAARAARLLTRLGEPGQPFPRAGRRVVEVYPAGSLRCWGVPTLDAAGRRSSYKRGPEAAEIRAHILERIRSETGLAADDKPAGVLVATDHALDALVAALTGVAVLQGKALAPRSPEEAALAALEGWIWLPDGTLGTL
jgi:predicted nuclease with RNAse H fold